MDNAELSFKHMQIATLIYGSWLDDRNPNTEFNQDMAKAAERGRAKGKAARGKLAMETDIYHKTLQEYADMQEGKKMFEVIPLDIYNPLLSPKLSDTTHPLRKAEERYFLALHTIDDTGNSVENWALIGMARTDTSGASPINILFPPPKEKRGRSKSGLSIDYRRAVWKLLLEDIEVTISSADGEEGELTFSGENLFTLNELLDVFLSEHDNPTLAGSLQAFQEINNRLQLKGVSRDTLITSFSRGEKERREMWES